MLDRFRVMRTLDVGVVCFPERPFKAALTAAQRAVRGMVKEGLIRRYKTDRFQTIYGLTLKGAEWLRDHGREQAESSVRRTSDMTNPEHRLWLQLIVLAAEARGLRAETEQELLRRLNQGHGALSSMVQGPLVVNVSINGVTESRTLRPDALLFEPDGATWVEVDRSKRGGDRESALRALGLSVGCELTKGPTLRRVVIFCKSDRIAARALAVIRGLARDQSEKVLIGGRRHFAETAPGVFEVRAAQEVRLADGRVMERPELVGHVIVQMLPVWLPKVRIDARNQHRIDGWLTDDYLPYRRAACGTAWPSLASPLLAAQGG
ncbi:MAG: replication-relaxation family protein [Proteobacteria bacterium]|nr:replication-relaxation family protein [Pseudomonadota bacterium]